MKKQLWIAISFMLIACQPIIAQRLPVVEQPVFRKDTINIKRYGAIPDGNTINTKAINDAIAAMNQRKGGVVLVPAGLWLTGPIALRSNVNLHHATACQQFLPLTFCKFILLNHTPCITVTIDDALSGYSNIRCASR